MLNIKNFDERNVPLKFSFNGKLEIYLSNDRRIKLQVQVDSWAIDS